MTGGPSRTIALVLYPRFTALDIVGPYEVLSRLETAGAPFRTVWVAETLDPVHSDRGAVLVPEETFDSVGEVEVLIVPGGPGQLEQMENPALMGFLKRAATEASVVASVCTGSLLLAKAGLLHGRRAATHWLARNALAELGAVPVNERVVRDGNFVTCARVSAGIDFALTLAADLAGPEIAQAIQLGIEYDPQPPFGAGSPSTAAPELVGLLRAGARRFLWNDED